jgi:hypothetical protein
MLMLMLMLLSDQSWEHPLLVSSELLEVRPGYVDALKSRP